MEVVGWAEAWGQGVFLGFGAGQGVFQQAGKKAVRLAEQVLKTGL